MPILSHITRTANNLARPVHTLSNSLNVNNKQYERLIVRAPSLSIVPNCGLKSSSKIHSISALGDPENKGHRQTGWNFDVLGSWNNRLELNVNVQQSIKRGSLIPQITIDNIGTGTLLGRRKYNEDRMLICEVKPGLLMFGVFDGHGGDTASQYAQDFLIDHVTFWLERGERDLETVLRNAFIDLNNMFTRSVYQKQTGEGDSGAGGTTATVCLLQDDAYLYYGHVGDSRAILCREGKAKKLTKEHSPDDPEELDRIMATGGRVTWSSIGRPRVNGKLEMTRSIGDLDLKAVGVTAEPETGKIRIRHSRDAFVVLCTDGIHHVLNSQQIVDIVAQARDPHEAARFTPDQALLFGSEDNCTVIVVPFGSWGKFVSKTFTSGFARSMIRSRVD